ncbi:hypothetical protein BDV06DRAFT_199104 [Aspergillus oleicola]
MIFAGIRLDFPYGVRMSHIWTISENASPSSSPVASTFAPSSTGGFALQNCSTIGAGAEIAVAVAATVEVATAMNHQARALWMGGLWSGQPIRTSQGRKRRV